MSHPQEGTGKGKSKTKSEAAHNRPDSTGAPVEANGKGKRKAPNRPRVFVQQHRRNSAESRRKVQKAAFC
eukprot:7689463-Alexandrium_andersonii.AAC.1